MIGYQLLGLLEIGTELENPFGFDDNDLDLDKFAAEAIHSKSQRDQSTLLVRRRSHPRCSGMLPKMYTYICTSSAFGYYVHLYMNTFMGLRHFRSIPCIVRPCWQLYLHGFAIL